jgi:hypothetical protein
MVVDVVNPAEPEVQAPVFFACSEVRQFHQ